MTIEFKTDLDGVFLLARNNFDVTHENFMKGDTLQVKQVQQMRPPFSDMSTVTLIDGRTLTITTECFEVLT